MIWFDKEKKKRKNIQTNKQTMITSTFRFRGLVPDVEEDLVCMMCFDKEKNAYKETNGYQYI